MLRYTLKRLCSSAPRRLFSAEKSIKPVKLIQKYRSGFDAALTCGQFDVAKGIFEESMGDVDAYVHWIRIYEKQPNEPHSFTLFTSIDPYVRIERWESQLISIACSNNYIDVLNRLKEWNPKLEFTNDHVLLACKYGNLEALKKLSQWNSEYDFTFNNCEPYRVAKKNDHRKIMHYLHDQNPEIIKLAEGYEWFIKACQDDKYDLVSQLVKDYDVKSLVENRDHHIFPPRIQNLLDVHYVFKENK